MSPTRRDLFRRAAATVAAASVAAIPTVPAVAKPQGFASKMDINSKFSSNFGAFNVTLCYAWAAWTPAKRKHFVEALDDMLGREFPDLLADAVELIGRTDESRQREAA